MVLSQPTFENVGIGINQDPHCLSGWRGILFGIVIGVLIVSLLFAACFIQYAPMDAIKYRRAKKRELKVRAEKETLN